MTGTLSSTVFSALKVVYDCSKDLYALLSEVAVQDEGPFRLQDDLAKLQRGLVNVDKALRASSLRATDEPSLWQVVGAAMHECQNTIEALDKRIHQIRQGAVKEAVLREGDLQFKPEEVVVLRAKLRVHTAACDVILQTVVSHGSIAMENGTQEESGSHARTLQRALDELHNAVSAPEVGDEDLRSIRKKLGEAARAVATRKSDEHEDADMERTVVLDDTDRSNTASAEPLSPETRKRISTWMARNPSEPGNPPLTSEHPPSSASNASASAKGPANVSPRILSTSEEDDGDDSDDDDFEIEMIEKYLTEGRARSQTRNYAQAEAFLRKALEKAASLGDRLKDLRIQDIELELAEACFLQGNTTEALQHVDQVIRRTPENDAERRTLLAASHLRAQVLLRQGVLDAAARQCKKTLQARRRLGKDKAYFESVALLSTIYKLKGDEVDAVTYGSLLPAGFERPTFLLPEPGARPTTSSVTKGVPEDQSAMDAIKPLQHVSMAKKSSETLTSVLTESTARDAETDSMLSSNLSAGGKAPSMRNDSVPFSDGTALTTYTDEDPVSLRPRGLSVPRRPSALQRTAALNSFGSGSATSSLSAMAISPGTAVSPGSSPQLAQAPGADEKECVVESYPYFGAPPQKTNSSKSSPTLTREPEWAKIAVTELSRNGSSRSHSNLEVVHQTFTRVTRQDPGTVSMFNQLTAHSILEQNGVPLTEPRDWSHDFLWAAAHGHATVVRLLLTDWQYQKPSKLHHAFKPKKVIMHSRVRVDTADTRKRTALHLAAAKGHAKVVQALLDNGAAASFRMDAEPSARPTGRATPGRTALECAIAEGHSETVDTFISNGSYDDSTDGHGWSLLHHAAFFGNRSALIAGLNRDFNTSAKTDQGKTPLHLAAQSGRDGLVELLLARKVEKDARDVNGDTPLSLAVSGGYKSCVVSLLEAGADVRAVDKHGSSVLHVAARKGHSHLLSSLNSKGADLDACDEHSRTPLFYAAVADKVVTVRSLLELGANKHARDYEGNTVLHCVAECGHVTVLEALLAEDISVNQVNRLGKTPLILAAQGGHQGAVMSLLPQTADIDQRDAAGKTALAHAYLNHHSSVQKLLELNGAAG